MNHRSLEKFLINVSHYEEANPFFKYFCPTKSCHKYKITTRYHKMSDVWMQFHFMRTMMISKELPNFLEIFFYQFRMHNQFLFDYVSHPNVDFSRGKIVMVR